MESNNQNQEVSEVVAQAAEVQTEQAQVELTPMQKMLAARKARKQAINRRKQESGFKKYVENIMARHKRVNNRINTELSVLKNIIGAKDFAMLKEICTVTTPEQKNEQGEVTQAERKDVNKQALMVEARNLIVLQREERIKKGLRKKTTGRSSKRAAHRSAVKFLTERNKQAEQEAK